LIVLFVWNRLVAHRVIRDSSATTNSAVPPNQRWPKN